MGTVARHGARNWPTPGSTTTRTGTTSTSSTVATSTRRSLVALATSPTSVVAVVATVNNRGCASTSPKTVSKLVRKSAPTTTWASRVVNVRRVSKRTKKVRTRASSRSEHQMTGHGNAFYSTSGTSSTGTNTVESKRRRRRNTATSCMGATTFGRGCTTGTAPASYSISSMSRGYQSHHPRPTQNDRSGDTENVATKNVDTGTPPGD